ncbi:MAG: hypothetical protein HYU84_11130 [Chloroflexi bacterium]|nr:hypothetical protein [Chloroflexota bacterium]
MTNRKFAVFWRVLIGAVIGMAVSFALAQTFFGLGSRAFIDQLFLVFVPAAAIFVCLLYLLPVFEKSLEGTFFPVRIFIFIWALVSALLSLLITRYSFISLLLLLVIFLLLTVPATSSVQSIVEAGGRRRVFGAWLFAFFFGSLLIGFLDNFYTNPIEIFLLAVFLQAVFGVGGYFLMGRVRRVATERWFDAVVHGVLFAMLIGFIAWLFQTSRQVSLFPVSYFVLNGETQGVFLFTSLLALPWQAWFHLKLKFGGFYNRVKRTRVYAYVSANLAGFSLSLLFFVLYLLFASVINDPRFDVDDIFFDADGMNYRVRLTTDNWHDFYWRSVHPFMILLFKPSVDLIAFFLKGNKLWGAYVFVALGGAACIYLAWTFIKSASGNSVYASLIAALLGLTASHLIFASLIESYIFLAASLLLFYVLLLKDKPLPALVTASLMTIGITYTNFAQNVIALFAVRPNIKQIIRFVASVLVFLVLLTLLNNLLFPDSHPFFFVPSTLQAEQQNLFPLNSLRVQALTRAFFFHNVAAPTPIFYDKDIPFIQFRFFKPEIDELSQYDLPIQNVTSWVWLGLLVLGGALFLLNLKKNQHLRLSIALMGCMALNMGLHLRYGKEVFLYTPNWTYALVLFLGLAWQGFHDHKWFQVILLVFLSLLIWNNGILLQTILEVLAEQV